MAETPAQSEGFGDFIVQYDPEIRRLAEGIPGGSFYPINELYGVVYVPLEGLDELPVNSYAYGSIPKCYAPMDLESLNASGISSILNQPYLELSGAGTLIAFLDSGIDYQNPLFRRENRSRILGIWDQTLEGGEGEPVPYGRFFEQEELDRALACADPAAAVPTSDASGHGTMLAALACGSTCLEEGFSGAAPQASLLVVKIKPAKQYLRRFFLFPPEAELYQEDDLMTALSFCVDYARDRGMPLSVCLGIGSSQGAHLGRNPLSNYVDHVADFSKISVSCAGGNEGAARHHYLGQLDERSDMAAAELRVGEGEGGFTMEFWGEPPENYSLSIQTPTGEILEVSSSLGAVTQQLSFVFVKTQVLANYVAIERQTGNTLVFFRFLEPAPGIWRILVRGREGKRASFHMWLPVTGLISEGTYFLEASPYNTVTAPGDSRKGITATAYQYRDNSLYLAASRGFMPDGGITPRLAAPGVGIRVPLPTGDYGSASGTSLSAAQAAGAAALLFQWAVIQGNQPYFNGSSVKNYLERGAVRDRGLSYPNPDWGYGRMDLYNTFRLLT
ncbi:MAG: S8 family peptidase [Eubacteriales bacterium]|nr:S8 family peptidase [Eubacteriales bacterium]